MRQVPAARSLQDFGGHSVTPKDKMSGFGETLGENIENSMLNLADIVGEYVPLTRESDSHYIGQCPFCSTPGSLILSMDNPYWSLDKQGWSCLFCGAEGDRYDFVARAEHVSRADAILILAHHTNTHEPLPHAHINAPGAAAAEGKIATLASLARRPAKVDVERRTDKPSVMDAQGRKEMMTRLVKFRNIIPSYQGAAVQNDESRHIVFADDEFPLSAELGELAEMLWPIITHAETVFPEARQDQVMANTLSLASDEFAILGHKFGRARSDVMLIVVRLGNPSELPVARYVINSVFPMT